jgi:hypothetical protein
LAGFRYQRPLCRPNPPSIKCTTDRFWPVAVLPAGPEPGVRKLYTCPASMTPRTSAYGRELTFGQLASPVSENFTPPSRLRHPECRLLADSGSSPLSGPGAGASAC